MTELPYTVDWAATAQMLVGIAAIAALFVAPWINFKVARRLAVAERRQQWLDALRADVAELVAQHGEVVSFRTKQLVRVGEPTSPPGSMLRISELSARIRMRLNIDDPDQLALHEAVSDYMTNFEVADPNSILPAMDVIVRKVWGDVKAGR